LSRFPVLRTLYLDVQDDQIEIFADLLDSTAPATLDATGKTKTRGVPFFNVQELVIVNMSDLPTRGLKVLLMNAFPSLETLHLADEFEDDQLAAIFSGTIVLPVTRSGCDTNVDQAPTGGAND
jgi:hypothetical protein